MLERLLEHWLDSVNERTYQSAFCQLLAAQGYKVVHSTRHMPLEFGKDVIALGQDGIPCAYQLKGNPRGRLTLAQYREIAPQLNELVTQAIVYPGIPNIPHRSYLVTNGLVEEEVQRAIDDYNRRLLQLGIPEDQHLRIISRGDLLNQLIQYGSAIWPVEISPMNALLELLVCEGREIFPIDKLHEILKGLLGLESKRTVRSAADLKQKIFSAAIMTAICLTSFERKGNAYARICAWTLYVSYVHGACEKYGHSYDNNGKAAVEIARAAIFDALGLVWETIRERAPKIRKHRPQADKDTVFRIALVQAGGLSNFVAAPGRITLVSALLAIFWFWSEEEGWSDDTTRQCFKDVMPVPVKGLDLWGEGATPQILAHLWHWRAVDATQAPNYQLAGLLGLVIGRATRKPGLPSPYYSYEDVLRHFLGGILTAVPDELEREDFTYTSFVSEGLLHLLVKINLKMTCKARWPDYSRVMNIASVPKERWQFCLLKNKTGKTVTTQFEPTKKMG